MTSRECFNRTCLFERAERPVKWEILGFWGQTVARWRKEGLPENVDPGTYFDMDPRVYAPGTGFTAMPYYPAFTDELIKDEGSTRLVRGGDGIIKRERSDHPKLKHAPMGQVSRGFKERLGRD
jgi:hypothetical protein